MATDWNRLAEEHELEYFRADVCLGLPQSFSLDEKRKICEEMESNTNEIDEAMRRDFQQLPPIAQGKMLDLLQKADAEHAQILVLSEIADLLQLVSDFEDVIGNTEPCAYMSDGFHVEGVAGKTRQELDVPMSVLIESNHRI